MFTRLLRHAFPLLDYWLTVGSAAARLARISVDRADLQICLYQGQFRIGYAEKRHEDLSERVGIIGVEPMAEDWEGAVRRAIKMATNG